MEQFPKIIIIAGSDSSAGAGIQADIKTSFAHKVYASTAITSITAQNTTGVQQVFDLPAEIISAQIDSVMSDVGAKYAKLGMLSNKDIINAVADKLSEYPSLKVVADPVMIAKGGHKLLEDEAIELLKEKILQKAFLITPNIPEAETLSGINISGLDDMVEAAHKISKELSPENILLKGGHLEQPELYDILYSTKKNKIILKISSDRIETKNTHGTGCTYASAITSNLALGESIEEAVKKAHGYVYNAIKKAPKNIGKGHGPVYHWL